MTRSTRNRLLLTLIAIGVVVGGGGVGRYLYERSADERAPGLFLVTVTAAGGESVTTSFDAEGSYEAMTRRITDALAPLDAAEPLGDWVGQFEIAYHRHKLFNARHPANWDTGDGLIFFNLGVGELKAMTHKVGIWIDIGAPSGDRYYAAGYQIDSTPRFDSIAALTAHHTDALMARVRSIKSRTDAHD